MANLLVGDYDHKINTFHFELNDEWFLKNNKGNISNHYICLVYHWVLIHFEDHALLSLSFKKALTLSILLQ